MPSFFCGFGDSWIFGCETFAGVGVKRPLCARPRWDGAYFDSLLLGFSFASYLLFFSISKWINMSQATLRRHIDRQMRPNSGARMERLVTDLFVNKSGKCWDILNPSIRELKYLLIYWNYPTSKIMFYEVLSKHIQHLLAPALDNFEPLTPPLFSPPSAFQSTHSRFPCNLLVHTAHLSLCTIHSSS